MNSIFINHNKNLGNNLLSLNLKTKENYNNKKIKKIFYNKNYFKSERIYYFDWLRIISSFFVILIHVTAYYYYEYKINSYKWKITFYYNGICRCAVPNFFMISGALFLKRDLTFRKIFGNIKKLIIHLLCWSLVYSIFNGQFSKINIKKTIVEFLSGHYHLWYIFAIINLYIIVPFLREISKKEKLLNIFINLSFIILILLPNIIYIFFYFSINIYDILNFIKIKLNINGFFGINIFYFVYGYYINIKKFKNKINRMIIYFLGLTGIFVTTVISYNFSIIKNKIIDHNNFKFFNIFFTSTSIFVFFKINFNKKKDFIKKISYYTLGIYLIHPLIIEQVMIKLKFISLSLNIIYLIPLISLATFLLSLIISIIINFIPIIGKYFI